MSILLLGCGEMGSVIGTDLLKTYEGDLVFADKDVVRAEGLAKRYPKRNVRTYAVDVKSTSSLLQLIKESKAKVLINAVNYYFNLEVMSACREAGINYLDLGGMFHTTRKQLLMDKEFKERGILAIPGMGSSPGITNILAAHCASQLDRVQSIEISFADKDYTKYATSMVLPYSILTLFDEFSDDPVLFTGGKYVTTKALTGGTDIIFPKPLNKAKCFFTLHSEAATLPASFPYLKTCNFRGGFDPALIEKIRFLIDIGFSSKDGVKLLDGKEVSPRDIIVKMTDKFIPKQKINDLEFLRVEVTGQKHEKKKKIVAYCESFTNKRWNIPAGSWNTGVAPSVVAQMIINGQINATGVVPPELAVDRKIFFKELERRAMKIFTASK